MADVYARRTTERAGRKQAEYAVQKFRVRPHDSVDDEDMDQKPNNEEEI